MAGAVRFEDQGEFHPVRYADGLAAALRGPVHEHTTVTGIGSGRVADRPGGMYLSTESPAHSIRAHGEWLLVGGESHKTGQADAAERYERLGAWARERFGLEPELRWATQDQMPMDGVPYVGRHDPLSRRPGHEARRAPLHAPRLPARLERAEETWDCPCHGSRFSASGEVIEGPAVNPLRL